MEKIPKFDREELEDIDNCLRNMFLPVFEHQGRQKGLTIEQVCKNVANQCNIGTIADRDSELFLFWLKNFISNRIHMRLMNKKCRHYLRGLMCERTSSSIGRVGNYYFPENIIEHTKIKEDIDNDIRGRRSKSTLRLTETKKNIQRIQESKREQLPLFD